MQYYTGLDVSLSTTFITIIDETGEIVKEGDVLTDPKNIADFLSKSGGSCEKIGIEAGQLSISLCKSLIPSPTLKQYTKQGAKPTNS